MLSLGIDQSYSCTGLLLLDNNKITHWDLIRTSKDYEIYERAWIISQSVHEVVKQYKPDVIGIEGLAFSGAGNATRDLAGLQFMLVIYLKYIYKHPNVQVIPPTTIKKFATGKGNCNKDAMVEALPRHIADCFVKLKLLKSKGLYDVCDAYWIAKYVSSIKS